MGSKVLVALGGNAILKHNEKGAAEKQFENIQKTCAHLVGLIRDGHRIAITHGNGPQVGSILLQNEMSRDILPPMPLDVCGAQSQGMIGYMLQQSMRNELNRVNLSIPVVALVTQTIVSEDDSAFGNPTKPIGPFYDGFEAQSVQQNKGFEMVEDSGRGYRRVVPSPRPKKIVETDTVKALIDNGTIVIAAGGGGIPVVVSENGRMKGVVAVIDKDLGAQILANDIGCDVLLMLTDIDRVYLHYGEPNQACIDRMTCVRAKRYLREGHFAPGSMAPKVEAAVKFIDGGGRRAVISSLETGREALEGKAGTTITS
ncbi:MAG: carbamate kinase [Candidatus Bathyarchaeota archaeon]|nr:MAG: carbamate kinase [Candidatus Bathyarchaeota archaeon]